MSTTITWSTAEIAPQERFAYWREAVCDAFLDLRPEADSTHRFGGEIVVQKRESIEVARISADAQHVARRASDDGGWCYLNLQTAGTARTVQGGVTVETRPGDAVLLRTDRPFRFEFDDRFEQYSVRLPNELSSLVDLPVFVGAASGLGRAVASMISLVGLRCSPRSHEDTAATQRGPALRDDDVGNWLDLALIDLSSEIIATERTTIRPIRRFDAWPLISADIDRHLGSAMLSPASTARRIGVSVRTLHHAFDDRPLTYAREVQRRRMALARSMLMDPACAEFRIRDVAVDCGFIDVQHFQRAYRRHHGETPGTTRAAN